MTGGAGFIGTALARQYAQSAERWVVIDNLLPQVHGPVPTVETVPGVEYKRADVRDVSGVREAVIGCQPDVVVHLAAETGTGQSLSMPSLHTDVNVTGTARLLEALEDHLPQRVVLTSSRAVYGEGDWVDAVGNVLRPGQRPRDMLERGEWDFPGLNPVAVSATSSFPEPSNVYGATKLAQEHLLKAWSMARGVSHSIVRLQNVYGPGQSPINPYTGITTLFVRLAKCGDSIPVYEDGRITRDFVYITDVVRAVGVVASAEGDLLLDVGSGTPATIMQMAREVAAIAGGPRPTITGQFRLGDVRHAACDMASSQAVFDGSKPVSLPDGLRALYEWIHHRA